jgi:SAM-dependent methyltransferase
MDDKLSVKIKLLKELGYNVSQGNTILDFGCGTGQTVKELIDRGFNGYGCEIKLRIEENTDGYLLFKEEKIRIIEADSYKLPFEDDFFDYIFSDEVFEHVLNYSETVSEIARVSKPDGVCLHIFPSRYQLIEPHIFVPLASIIRSRSWLFLWALLGIRNEFQQNQSSKETADFNYDFLRDNTNYLSRRQLMQEFKVKFNDVLFCEKLFLKSSPSWKKKLIYRLSTSFPFLPFLYSTFRTRIVLTKKPKKVSI